MPHPEHAVDELTGGSADGLKIFESMRLAVEGVACLTTRRRRCRPLEDALALGLTRAEYELVCEKQGGPPNQVELAMYSLLWSEHCAYKHSKKLLRTLPTEGPHVVMGPGENAGAVDVGGGPGVRVQGRVAQPPERGRALPGRGHRRRRILRDIFAIGARPIAVLDSLRFGEPADERARALPARRRRRRASATTATRSACRRSAARSTSRAPTSRTAWSTRWRSGSRRASGSCAAPPPARATCSSCSAPPPAATGSAAPRCSPRPSCGDGDDGQAPDRPGRRPVRGEEAARVLAGAARARAARLAAGPRRRRADLLGRRRWPPRARSGSTSTSRRCRCARPTWSRSR